MVVEPWPPPPVRRRAAAAAAAAAGAPPPRGGDATLPDPLRLNASRNVLNVAAMPGRLTGAAPAALEGRPAHAWSAPCRCPRHTRTPHALHSYPLTRVRAVRQPGTGHRGLAWTRE